MITKYKILSSKSLYDLEGDVNDYIGMGWQPLGGISNLETRLDVNDEPNEKGKFTILHMQAMGKPA